MNTYKLHEQPKPVGYWVLYAEHPYKNNFYMYRKPSWIHRWFTNKLLGWTWEDAE